MSEFFVSLYTSGQTGAEKPHAEAFEAVFATYPGARKGWMIGDSWHADVQGALAVGMRAILVRAQHSEATARCDTVTEVATIVERP